MLSRRTDFPYIGQYFGEEWMVMSFTWIGLLFDLLVVPMLLWRRTRMMAYFLAVLFHLTNAKLFDIGIFPLLMVAASMLFFPPDTLRKPQEGDTPPSKKPTVASTTPLTRFQKCGVWVLGVYVAFQLLFPFRHFLYPGDVNWTDEGHRFAWRMKLRIKSSSQAELYAVDGSGFQIPEAAITDDVLTARQRRVMSGRPDMLLQYAHFLADRFEQEQHQPADIRANVVVSLNGREPQRLIDPTVNLAEQKRTLRPSDWILPLADSVPQPPNH